MAGAEGGRVVISKNAATTVKVKVLAMIPLWITTSLGPRSASSARIATDVAVAAMCHETFIFCL